jgi:hypothetical protein
MTKRIALIGIFLTLFGQISFASQIQNEGVKSLAQIESSVATATGNISTSNACITTLSFSAGQYSSLGTGQFVYDSTNPTYIGSGVTIAGLPGTCSAGQIQLSATPTHASSGDTFTVGGQPSQLINTSKLWDAGSSQQVSTIFTNFSVSGLATAASGAGLVANGSGGTSWTSVLTNPMTTGGDQIVGGSGGTPTRVANGTYGQVWMSLGSTNAPGWQTASGNSAMFTAPATSIFTFNNTTFTGKVTSGSATVTNVSSFTGLYVGMGVSASADVTAGSYIISMNTGASTLVLSANATGGSSTTVTFTPYNSGSGYVTGTYVVPTSPACLYLEVWVQGGGGSGSGSGTSGGSGANGAASIFGNVTANNGSGASGSNGGAGGTVSVGSGFSGSEFWPGGAGASGAAVGQSPGPAGGNSVLYSGGGVGGNASAGTSPGAGGAAVAATGGGGGGGGMGTGGGSAGAGGAGGSYHGYVTGTLASSYAVQVGAYGTGGTAGTGGAAGGNGGAGLVTIKCAYQ